MISGEAVPHLLEQPAHTAVTLRDIAKRCFQYGEAVLKTVGYLMAWDRIELCGRQLYPQRRPLDQLADPGYGRQVLLNSEFRLYTLCCVHEELKSVVLLQTRLFMLVRGGHT